MASQSYQEPSSTAGTTLLVAQSQIMHDDEIPTTSLLAVDPSSLSLTKLRQFSKTVAFQIQRLQNARSALLESIGTRQQAQADAAGAGSGGGSAVAGANQKLRSMEVLLTQLDHFHQECLVAGREKRLETLQRVEENAVSNEGEILLKSQTHCDQVIENARKDLEMRKNYVKQKNNEHDDKVFDINVRRREAEISAHRDLVKQIRQTDKRHKKKAEEAAMEAEHKRQAREAKRAAAIERVQARERQVEAERQARAKSALERVRGETTATGGLVRSVLDGGSGTVLREKSLAEQRATLATSVRTPQPTSSFSNNNTGADRAKTRFGQSLSYKRLTEPKSAIPTADIMEKNFRAKQDEIKKWKTEELNILKQRNIDREQTHAEKNWEAHRDRMAFIKSVKKKEKEASKRLQLRKAVQEDLTLQMIEERNSQRERAKKRAESQQPGPDRWDHRATSILASVCGDLTKEFDISALDPSTTKARKGYINNSNTTGGPGSSSANKAMETVSRPGRGFESWK